jgi:GATA-binding protein
MQGSPIPDKVPGSPDLKPVDLTVDLDQLAKNDPLTTQVWKMYSRTRAMLPHAQRMENLSWRMMALALKKKKEDDDAKATSSSSSRSLKTPTTDSDENERGRRIDKGKAKVRVVGFNVTSQDGEEDVE